MHIFKFFILVCIAQFLTIPYYAISQNYVFTDVNIVPMDSMYVSENQDVVIENGIITEIGTTGTLHIPGGAQTIPASGKYLMPGLVDMHAHVYSDSFPTANFSIWEKEELILFVANGVTTIRNMWGDPGILQWREKIKNNELFGPTIFTSSPIIDGNPPYWDGSIEVSTPEHARVIVNEQKQLGYDYIKIYNGLSLEVYDAIMDEAEKLGIPVIGHIPSYVGLDHALASEQYGIEHFEGYHFAFGFNPPNLPIWENIDSLRLDEILTKTISSGTWNCPTLSLYSNIFLSIDDYYQALQKPEAKYVPQELKDIWEKSIISNYLDYYSVFKENTFHKKLLYALHQRGANIILGTDTPNPGVVPGFSIYEELQLFVDAGLTPYEAIKAGTYNASLSLNTSKEFGTITRGKRADLMLVNKNPLDDIAHIKDRIGVMARGNWYTKEQLDQKLDVLAKKYSLRVDSIDVDGMFKKPGIDTLQVTAQITNPYNFELTVLSCINENSHAYTDSIYLFDDGTHGDVHPNDGTYSGLLPVDTLESIFSVRSRVRSVDSGYYYISKDSSLFTTIGPLIPTTQAFIDTNYDHASNIQSFFLILQNSGKSESAENLIISLSTEDTRVEKMVYGTRNFPDLDAGEIDTTSINSFFSFKYADSFIPDCTGVIPIRFDVEVSSDGYPFWTSSFEFIAEKGVTSIEYLEESLPNDFVLFHNYPNPFNPVTTIAYQLPKSSKVDLSIYNLLGQKIATLVSQEQPAGTYKVEWDAGGFSSGVYFYRLKTDQNFVQSQKLVVLK